MFREQNATPENEMSHRQKGKHKPRHHTHAVKPANRVTPGLPPYVPAEAATASPAEPITATPVVDAPISSPEEEAVASIA